MKLLAYLTTISTILATIGASAQKPTAAPNWLSFRGDQAAGVADDQNLPDRWDGDAGTSIKWKTRLPGLSHSSPVVWGDRIFITTAIMATPAISEGLMFVRAQNDLFAIGR